MPLGKGESLKVTMLRGRPIVLGLSRGRALVSMKPISFLGGVDKKSWNRNRDDEFCEGSLLCAYLQRGWRNPGTAETMHRHGMFTLGGEKLKRRNGLLHDAPVWAPVEERTRLLFCQI